VHLIWNVILGEVAFTNLAFSGPDQARLGRNPDQRCEWQAIVALSRLSVALLTLHVLLWVPLQRVPTVAATIILRRKFRTPTA
jgi:hypothetical protein